MPPIAAEIWVSSSTTCGDGAVPEPYAGAVLAYPPPGAFLVTLEQDGGLLTLSVNKSEP